MHRVVLDVEYCDDYLGYTLCSWIEEVKDVIESEHCVEIVYRCRRTDRCGEYDPKLLVNDVPVLEGIPGEEGYLIEVLKKVLIEMDITCYERSESV